MAKTEGAAGERAGLYWSIAEEAERRNISNKSVCEERGVSYNSFPVFRSRQHRKDNDGITVKRIVPEPEAAPEQDRIEISVTMQCKRYWGLSRMYRREGKPEIILITGYTDFRCKINSLTALLTSKGLHPFVDAVYVFCRKSRSSVKMLYWGGSGFWLIQYRREKGKVA